MDFKSIFISFILPWISLAMISCDCSGRSVKVVNWNVQTFFDARAEGCEYSEFQKSSNWGEEAYRARLRLLADSLELLDGDIIVMEEIENKDCLFDIKNFMREDWSGRKNYCHACFAKEEGGAIGIGILSRFPIEGMTLHSLDVSGESSPMPKMRPVMRVKISVDGRRLNVVANHWKSKSGGEARTEIWRNRQEGTLARILEEISEEGEAAVILGDFNRDICDFAVSGCGTATMRFWRRGTLSDEGMEVVSAWLLEGELCEPGSYFFRGEWSRIDNIFFTKNLRVENFRAETEGPWCDSETSVPKKYALYRNEGFSDHLPISCVIGLRPL